MNYLVWWRIFTEADRHLNSICPAAALPTVPSAAK
jgi:hypothetical protein